MFCFNWGQRSHDKAHSSASKHMHMHAPLKCRISGVSPLNQVLLLLIQSCGTPQVKWWGPSVIASYHDNPSLLLHGRNKNLPGTGWSMDSYCIDTTNMLAYQANPPLLVSYAVYVCDDNKQELLFYRRVKIWMVIYQHIFSCFFT